MLAPDQKPRDLSSLRIHRPEDGESRRGPGKGIIIWIVGISLAVVLALVVYERWVAPRSYPVVETMTVRESVNVPDLTLLSATGYLVADRQANLSAMVSGRVVKMFVDTGSNVSAGQPIAVIESDLLQAQLREAEAAVADAQREYNRQRALFREGVTSRALVDDAEARLKMAEARRDQVNVNIRDSVIRAPFGGTVVAKNAEEGEMVSSVNVSGFQTSTANGGGSIATIADLRTLEVEADVNEGNLARLKVGQPAEVAVDAFPNRKFHGRLRKVIPAADRAKGVVKVRVAIQQAPDARLLPDMASTVTFLESARTEQQLREKARIWIPAGAVITDPSGSRVFIVTPENTVQVRRVKIGESREDRAEVVTGLTSGERIVTADVEKLSEGQRVKTSEKS